MNRYFFSIILAVLLIDSSKQSHIKQTIKTFKSIGKTIKSPLFKTIGNNIKVPIMKTVGNTIKNSLGMFRRNKNTIKNIACGFEEKYLKVGYNIGSKSVKYLGEKGINNFKYITPLAARVGNKLVRAPGKKNIWMKSNSQMSEKQLRPIVKKSVEQMKGEDFRSLINIVSKSKPQLPFLFATGGLNKLTEVNLVPSPQDCRTEVQGVTIEEIIAADKANVVQKEDAPMGQEITIGPKEHKSTQIWLHGIGHGPEGFTELFSDSETNPMPLSTKVCMPCAPTYPVTIYAGASMRCWFDIKKLDTTPDSYNMDDVTRMSKLIVARIEEEIEKVGGDSKKVYIGGFSSGAAMALHIGLGFPKPLGGIFGLSGFKFMQTETHESNKNIPVLLVHGTFDTTLFYESVQTSYEHNDWVSKNPNIEFHSLEHLDHEVNMDVVKLFKDFMAKLPKIE